LPAYVVVQLAKGGTKSARSTRMPLRSRKLKRVIAEHQGVLLPSEAETGEAQGTRFATIAVPDMARATRLAMALSGVEGIETAFAKPGEELP
jgi:hypothetical protein